MTEAVRGVVLAGGSGSRLDPLTRAVNKHLLPVGDLPMIYHPILALREAGILEVLVVTGVDHVGDLVRLLRSGEELGVDVTYRVQERPDGIVGALRLAEGFARGGRIAVVLGDNVFGEDLSESISDWVELGSPARIHVRTVVDPSRFGVVDVVGDRVVGIVEKPSDPPSDLAVAGIYFFDVDAEITDEFLGIGGTFELAGRIEPSARGELEITDLLRAYLRDDALDVYALLEEWSDAGTFASIAVADRIAREVAIRRTS